jgi:hypothetical protein
VHPVVFRQAARRPASVPNATPRPKQASSSASSSTSLIPSAPLTLSSPQRLHHHHHRCPNAPHRRPAPQWPPTRTCAVPTSVRAPSLPSMLSPVARPSPSPPQAKPQVTCANPLLQSSHTPSRPRTSRMATCRVCRLLALCMQRPPTDTCAGTMASTLPMAAVRITFPPAPNQLG